VDAIIRTIDPSRFERDRRDHDGRSDIPGIGQSETIIPQARVIALDEARRESERLLPPGATGSAGGAYKMLRTQVLRRLNQISANTLAVMSASSGEGKTLTAINLAIALAADLGHTALLVDLDLRNPSIHRRLGFEPEVGIEDCLQHRASIREAMVKITGYERLAVVPARSRVEHSSELLASQRMADLMVELRSRYGNRVLVFDLPPILLADDALAFSQHVETGLIVVAESITAREELTRSLVMLDKLPVIGTVLNRSQESADAYY
jgi:capsular exopolysaccharide synthesis family protein